MNITVLFFIFLFAFEWRSEAADTSSMLNDNANPPYLGIYEGPNKQGIELLPKYLVWLNRKHTWVQDTIPMGDTSTWTQISGKWQDWLYLPWMEWLKKNPDSRFVLSVPMLPGPIDGSGPKTEIGAGEPVSLAKGASGAYNVYFKGLAETLVRDHLENSIIRLGWEWNGNWYAWKVVTSDDAKNFSAYWKQIVNTMRSVPGAENLKFDWNVTSGFKTAYDPLEAYPGDAYVDYIGIDVYDTTWGSSEKYPQGFYPWPASASEAEVIDRHEEAWTKSILSDSDYGIEYWQKVADQKGKPLTIPEWGLMNRASGRGGNDNPAFIKHMYDYIVDPTHHIYFASYFDYNAGSDGECRISGTDGQPKPFPKGSAKMKELFSLPQ